MGTSPFYSAIFMKGDNFYDFLFASLDKVTLSKWGLLLKKRICSYGSKFFSLIVDPIEKGGKNDMGKTAYPESLFIHL